MSSLAKFNIARTSVLFTTSTFRRGSTVYLEKDIFTKLIMSMTFKSNKNEKMKVGMLTAFLPGGGAWGSGGGGTGPACCV